MRRIETFLPTFEATRIWRNRQRIKLAVPLFPSYIFVRTSTLDFDRVRHCPGVIRLIGNQHGPLPLPTTSIELLRASVSEKKIEPYTELIAGKRVRVKSGSMQGVEGLLIRRSNGMRFVLHIELINQNAAIEMDADNLEPISGRLIDDNFDSVQNFCA